VQLQCQLIRLLVKCITWVAARTVCPTLKEVFNRTIGFDVTMATDRPWSHSVYPGDHDRRGDRSIRFPGLRHGHGGRVQQVVFPDVYIRRDVEESPIFTSLQNAGKISAFPSRDVVSKHWRPLLLLIGGKLGEVTLYFTLVVFSVSYAITTLRFSRSDVLRAITIAAVFQLVGIPFFGWLGDRVGARRLYILGALLLAVSAIPLLTAMAS
jgi:Major Facilitator Superfamily